MNRICASLRPARLGRNARNAETFFKCCNRTSAFGTSRASTAPHRMSAFGGQSGHGFCSGKMSANNPKRTLRVSTRFHAFSVYLTQIAVGLVKYLINA